MSSRPVTFVIGWPILFAWIALNQWISVSWFDQSYLAWYLANGSLIGLVSSVAALSWGDINRHLGLISAHPFDYVGSYFQLAGLPITEMGTHLRRDRSTARSASTFDLLVGGVLALIISLVILGWILLVVPAQYFVYLVCGAPARVFAGSSRRIAARLGSAGRLDVKEVGADEEVPEGWWLASFAAKPVAFTGLLAALLLAIGRWAL